MLNPATAPPNLYAFSNLASGGYNVLTGLTQVSPALVAGQRTAIFICEGQSVAGDHCQGLYNVQSLNVHQVGVMADNNLYRLVEPMLGPTFTINGYVGWNSGYGSMWGQVGDLLISAGSYDRVIFCNVSVGGTTVFDQSPAGGFGHRLPLAFNTLNKLGYYPSQVTAILTHIGESDGINGTSSATYQLYRNQSMSVARNFGFTGPWFMANSTWAYDVSSSTIQGAIAALVANGTGFKAGANSDNFVGATYRYAEIAGPGSMRVHPNATGRDVIANDWLTKIKTGLGV